MIKITDTPDINAILKENKHRNALLNSEYNPLIGVGSPIERAVFRVNKSTKVFIPVQMFKDNLISKSLTYRSFKEFIDKNLKYIPVVIDDNGGYPLYLGLFHRIRIKYDFEYWAASSIVIKDKETGKPIQFMLNHPQRILLKEFEQSRLDNVPIRIEVVKARQWGGSTLTQLYSIWIQREHMPNWNSVIIGDVETQARTIRAMVSFMANHYPKYSGTMTLVPFEGTKNKVIVETGAVISIGSMKAPDSIRSQDVKIAHFSEVASYKKTEGKSPIDLMQSIKGSIPLLPMTMIVEESTAKGVGNYFHKAYLAAKNGKSNYKPVFIPWFSMERNRIKLHHPARFIKSMDEYERYLWDLGATLEGINWYRQVKKTEFFNNPLSMKQENPSTAEEAFQSTGSRVFPPDIILELRKNVIDPIFIGDIDAKARKGGEAFDNIEFYANDNGLMYVWAFPDKETLVDDRYVVSVDIGGASSGADYSIIRVFDKYWMLYGGKLEAILTWRGHIDQDLLAWKAAQIAYIYNNALLVIENNSLTKRRQTGGNNFYTVLNEISEYYDNIYISRINREENVNPGIPTKYGFHTNTSTKPLVINFTKSLIRDNEYLERDNRVCDEMDAYEYKQDNTMGAVDGMHDDLVMATSIGVWVSLRDSGFPTEHTKEEIEQQRQRVKSKKKTIVDF